MIIKKKDKPIYRSFYVSKEINDILKETADKQKRSVSSLICILLEKALKNIDVESGKESDTIERK